MSLKNKENKEYLQKRNKRIEEQENKPILSKIIYTKKYFIFCNGSYMYNGAIYLFVFNKSKKLDSTKSESPDDKSPGTPDRQPSGMKV